MANITRLQKKLSKLNEKIPATTYFEMKNHNFLNNSGFMSRQDTDAYCNQTRLKVERSSS